MDVPILLLRSQEMDVVRNWPQVSQHQEAQRENAFGTSAAIFAFFISVGFATRWTALLDYSYLPNLAFALSNGATLWADLDHPLPPGATLVTWLFYSIFGWSSFSSLMLTGLIGAASAFAAFRITLNLPVFAGGKASPVLMAFLSVQAAVFGPTLLVTFPFPDNFATLFCLFSILLTQRALRLGSRSAFFIAGVMASTPLVFKQNVGVLFLACSIGGLALLVSKYSERQPPLASRSLAFFLLGSVAVAFFGFLLLAFSGLLSDFYSQVIVGASASKNVLSFQQVTPYFGPVGFVSFALGLSLLFKPPPYLRRLVWLLVVLGSSALFLLPRFFLGHVERLLESVWVYESLDTAIIFLAIAPFVSGVLFARAILRIVGEEDFVLLVIAGTMIGAFLSQGYQGSSYSLAPLLMIFVWSSGASLFGPFRFQWGPLAVGVLLGVFLLSQAVTGARLQYVSLEGSRVDGHNVTSTTTGLIPVTDMQHRGYSQLRQLLEKEEGRILVLPSEDPLAFFAPESRGWWRCVQFIQNTCPSYLEAPAKLAADPPDVFVYKKFPQLPSDAVEPLGGKMSAALLACGTKVLDSELYVVARDFSDLKCLERMLAG